MILPNEKTSTHLSKLVQQKQNYAINYFTIAIVGYYKFLFFGFRTGFRPTNSGRLIWFVRKGMRTGQTLFPLGIEPSISRIRP